LTGSEPPLQLCDEIISRLTLQYPPDKNHDKAYLKAAIQPLTS
jgi:hypothetical protein